ncbi:MULTISPECIES: acyl-CoA thioesterase [Pseudomonas]|uniref:acyl-CoA thioesterase n=1 Tax=Pseudomonas TaxID=286 RepID=UPI00177EE0EB|nr:MULTISPECIES: thioesterase family protein [Pseudomonas]MBD9439784.1 thioesterase family protein [Pseudomonas sp. PDM04]
MKTSQPKAKPHELAVVKDEWIDLYGHMNMAYYVQLLDELGHRILGQFGLGEGYTLEHNCGLFTVEANVKYIREVRAGDPLRVELTPVRFDDKRLVTQVDLYHHEQNYLSASMCQTALHVDLGTRRVRPFTATATSRLQGLKDEFAANGWMDS